MKLKKGKVKWHLRSKVSVGFQTLGKKVKIFWKWSSPVWQIDRDNDIGQIAASVLKVPVPAPVPAPTPVPVPAPVSAPVLKAWQQLFTSLLLTCLQNRCGDPRSQIRDLHRFLSGEVANRSWTSCQRTKLCCWLRPEQISVDNLKYLKYLLAFPWRDIWWPPFISQISTNCVLKKDVGKT